MAVCPRSDDNGVVADRAGLRYASLPADLRAYRDMEFRSRMGRLTSRAEIDMLHAGKLTMAEYVRPWYVREYLKPQTSISQDRCRLSLPKVYETNDRLWSAGTTRILACTGLGSS
jgi:hypothetical protein